MADMGIAKYIKEIGRGKDGARALTREQAADLMAQILDAQVSDLELGAFCLAMRIKGETAQEMAGFLDASHPRLARLPASAKPLIVLPSYNGARKLAGLLPLLAMALARDGWPVLVHGMATENSRIFTSNTLLALGVTGGSTTEPIANGEVRFVPTATLSPGLQRLLDVRRVVGLRNSAHSLVKLMNPCLGASVLVTSYTHPEYASAMAQTLTLMQSTALLLRGTEGEPVADARRMPRMQGFVRGAEVLTQDAQGGSLATLPELPADIDAATTATYIREVLANKRPLPPPIAQQIEHIAALARQL